MRKKREKEKTKQKRCGRERTSDSYRRVTVALYIKWVKGTLALSPRMLGVPAKMLGAQSNTQISLARYHVGYLP